MRCNKQNLVLIIFSAAVFTGCAKQEDLNRVENNLSYVADRLNDTNKKLDQLVQFERLKNARLRREEALDEVALIIARARGFKAAVETLKANMKYNEEQQKRAKEQQRIDMQIAATQGNASVATPIGLGRAPVSTYAAEVAKRFPAIRRALRDSWPSKEVPGLSPLDTRGEIDSDDWDKIKEGYVYEIEKEYEAAEYSISGLSQRDLGKYFDDLRTYTPVLSEFLPQDDLEHWLGVWTNSDTGRRLRMDSFRVIFLKYGLSETLSRAMMGPGYNWRSKF